MSEAKLDPTHYSTHSLRRTKADLVLSLGSLTMMHELALLVWMEQLYRIYTVNAGLPYHRE